MQVTPLIEEHRKLNARFTEFAGYSMPVSYGAVKDEVMAVRESCGMFDVSHMLPIFLKAASREVLISALNKVCVRPTDKLKPGKAQYNALYNEHAGLVDDITMSSVSDTQWMIVANASNRDAVIAHLKTHCTGISVEPWSDYVLLAIQGPKAAELIAKRWPIAGELYYYEVALPEPRLFIGRMGYTGEDGFEIACDAQQGIKLWQELSASGAKACGLAARDVLRVEALMPLYGHELSANLRPQESGIGFIYADHDCIAPRALRERPVEKITCGFRMLTDGIPRQGYPIADATGATVGEVTSGTFSFTQNYGMGLMRIAAAAKDSELFVMIRGEAKRISLLEKSPIQGRVRRRPKP